MTERMQVAREQVILLSDDGAAIGTMDKTTAHHANTPLHLAFSCYLFDRSGRVLLTRRATGKRVFPGVLTNSCCGHPSVGEPITHAVQRRVRDELGLNLDIERIQLLLPEFAYRAEMDGIVENERCPVFMAVIDGEANFAPDPHEVGGVEWREWTATATAIVTGALDVSPWCALQVHELIALGDDPQTWRPGEPSALPPAARLV